MGYQSTLYFVEKTKTTHVCDDGVRRYFGIILAVAEMHKCERMQFHNVPDADTYIYSLNDGNLQIIEDGYEVPLRQMSLEDFITDIKKVIGTRKYTYMDGSTYYPLVLAQNIAETLLSVASQGKEIVVLHYGY